MTFQLVVDVPAFGIEFRAEYDDRDEAIENAKMLWDMLRPDLKLELMVPPNGKTDFGVYDSTRPEEDFTWRPMTSKAHPGHKAEEASE